MPESRTGAPSDSAVALAALVLPTSASGGRQAQPAGGECLVYRLARVRGRVAYHEGLGDQLLGLDLLQLGPGMTRGHRDDHLVVAEVDLLEARGRLSARFGRRNAEFRPAGATSSRTTTEFAITSSTDRCRPRSCSYSTSRPGRTNSAIVWLTASRTGESSFERPAISSSTASAWARSFRAST